MLAYGAFPFQETGLIVPQGHCCPQLSLICIDRALGSSEQHA